MMSIGTSVSGAPGPGQHQEGLSVDKAGRSGGTTDMGLVPAFSSGGHDLEAERRTFGAGAPSAGCSPQTCCHFLEEDWA